MNIVNVILAAQYGDDYDNSRKSYVSTMVFVGSVIGQIVFGFFADRMGRKKIMLITAALLIIGGILCTCASVGSPSTTLTLLGIYRLILGLGIGGEYPLSSTYTAEAYPVEDRGKQVTLTFSMQGIGQLGASLFGNMLVQTLANSPTGDYDKKNLEIIWRLLFAIGTLPAICILYPRWKAEENNHFSAHNEKVPLKMKIGFILRHYGLRLLGTAGTWFLFDIVFYANGLFAASILDTIGVGESTLQVVTLQNLWLSVGAIPGYYVAAFTMDKVGRRNMQLQGFFFMAVIFLVMGFAFDSIKKSAGLFIVLYALTFFFANFGPNSTTFLIPVESFPTPLRATCHGFSAAMGKTVRLLVHHCSNRWPLNMAQM